MNVVVGVDGGNTKTIAVAADLEGQARGLGRGGCGNWERLGEHGAAELITDVVSEALDMAGVSRSQVAYVHLGLAQAALGMEAGEQKEELVAQFEKIARSEGVTKVGEFGEPSAPDAWLAARRSWRHAAAD